MNPLIRRDEIEVSNSKYNVLFNVVMLLGSLGFVTIGISSYVHRNILFFLDASEILFFPQGATMLFYGTLGTIISIYQLLLIYWEVGKGFNEFNKETGKATIFRKGFPGKNSEVQLIYSLEDIVRFIKRRTLEEKAKGENTKVCQEFYYIQIQRRIQVKKNTNTKEVLRKKHTKTAEENKAVYV